MITMGMLVHLKKISKREGEGREVPLTTEELLKKIDTVMNQTPTPQGSHNGTEEE